MAVVQGIREKVHLPLYDSVSVDPEKQVSDVEKSGTLKFFVNVQGKTKLETNLQSASLLPHYNTFEARAMRVVISDLPPEFPDSENDKDKAKIEDLDVTNEDGDLLDATGTVTTDDSSAVTASLEVTVNRLVKLYKEARENTEDHTAEVDLDDEDVELDVADADYDTIEAALLGAGGSIVLTLEDLDQMNESLKAKGIPKEQLDPNNGSGTIIGKLVYNTVTTLFVGEKQMISMPTWFFPAGAGPYSETGKFTTHGEPSPSATFRFAEPIYIDKQQNFRVEIEIPDSNVLKDIQKIYGPMNIWVVLDGYMTRDVQ
jgi:hypothetical protein